MKRGAVYLVVLDDFDERRSPASELRIVFVAAKNPTEAGEVAHEYDGNPPLLCLELTAEVAAQIASDERIEILKHF